jgi:hypothetical protein
VFLKVFSEDQEVSFQGEDSSRISKDIENMIEQLADKETELQYTPKKRKLRAELVLLPKYIGINVSMNG